MRFLLLFFMLLAVGTTQAQTNTKPMIMPAAGDPGPGTWMFGQAYGNTTGAFNFGDRWYEAGQGLHFGIDLALPCGSPLVAVANGTVQFVDDRGFGSMPHNLIIRHEALGVTTLYGHLLEPPSVFPGQMVQQGQVVGLSGDPDETCTSRPHLHFEVRSLDYSQTFNPVDYIDANWHSLALIGPYSFPLFQHNMENPRTWVHLDDQPEVFFWGGIVNRYNITYPARFDRRPAPNPIPARSLPPLTENARFAPRQITGGECCALARWNPADPSKFYVVEGTPSNLAGVFEWDITAPENRGVRMRPAPMPHQSPHGIYTLEPFINDTTKIKGPDFEANVPTGGRIPTVNPANTTLLWAVSADVVVPGQQRPVTRVFTSQLNGDGTREIFAAPGADARWLDDTRVLISIRDDQRRTSLAIYDTLSGALAELGQWRELRGLSTSPGGRHIAFYISWQQDPADNGIYIIDTANNNQIQQMDWFGAWRWRDTTSVYYVPYQPGTATHTLRAYNLETGTNLLLTDPATTEVTIANGEWHVSPDGTRILYQDASDNNLYVLEPLP